MSETTGLPERFEIGEDHAVHRPEGNVSFHEAGEVLSQAVVYCRENAIRRLLIDTTKLTGFGPIGTAERFAIGETLARAAMAAVKLAMVVRPELLDPALFGITVARNRGLFSNAFTSESEALKWLLDPSAE
ncbi:MAG: hypothetical protein ACXVID_06605 [Thermoanaerobaculia bacterium]